MPGVKGKSGAKPKPNAHKKLAKSKHAVDNAVEFDLISNVDAPEWMPELARQMWETVCPHLCKQHVLAVTDLHNLEAFCMAYSRWRDAEQEIMKDGIVVEGATGGPIKNPACTVANESMRQIAQFGSALGLDPAARGRLIGSQGPGKRNPFEQF